MGLGAGAWGRAPLCGPGGLQRAVGGLAWMGSLGEGSRSFSDMVRPGPTVPTVFARRLCHLIFKDSSKNCCQGFVTLPTSAFNSEQTPQQAVCLNPLL